MTLLRRFGSLTALARATVDEVAQAGHLPRPLAEAILQRLSAGARGGRP